MRPFRSRIGPSRLRALAGGVVLVAGTVARTSEYQSSLTLAETTVERWPTPEALAAVSPG